MPCKIGYQNDHSDATMYVVHNSTDYDKLLQKLSSIEQQLMCCDLYDIF